MNEQNIKDIQSEVCEQIAREQAMQNVTCPKLAKTLVKLQQVNNEFYEEYDRAFDLGARDKDDKMELEFMNAYDEVQGVITKLMTKILQMELYEALPINYDKK